MGRGTRRPGTGTLAGSGRELSGFMEEFVLLNVKLNKHGEV